METSSIQLSSTSAIPDPGWHQESSCEVRHWLAALSSEGIHVRNGLQIDEILNGLSKSIQRVLTEHEGMSAELLGAYEQLGVVFEVTRRLPGVQHEQEVILLFVESLRQSFSGARVLVSTPSPGDGIQDPSTDRNGSSSDDREWDAGELAGLIDRARTEGRIQVERRATGTVVADGPAVAAGSAGAAEANGHLEVMVGPIFAGKNYVCSIVLSRPLASPVASESIGFRAGDMRLVEALTQFCGDLLRSHRLVAELREMSLATVRALVNAVDQKDEYTSGHSIRVGYYTCMLGCSLGLSNDELQLLQWSALLHDVGKIGIRDEVLKKTDRLTEEEFRHIKEHPVRSFKVVQQIPQLAGALDGVLHHHEHYDGGGYPQGLKGENIPLQARIIQIADVFDALTSNRSYRPARTWEAALEIMRHESGTTVDPRLCETFEGLVRRELSNDPRGWEGLLDRANRFTLDPIWDEKWRDSQRTRGGTVRSESLSVQRRTT